MDAGKSENPKKATRSNVGTSAGRAGSAMRETEFPSGGAAGEVKEGGSGSSVQGAATIL